MGKSCANCGAQISEGAPVCDNCGMPVSEAASPQEAPPQRVSTEPPLTPPLVEEGTPEHRPQLEQSERLPPSQATPSDSALAQDPRGGEHHRGVARWVIRVAGLVGTAAAGLVGMATFWRRGVGAREQNSAADDGTQQSSMGVTEADVQDPDPIEQSEAPPDLVDEITTTAAPPTPPPEGPVIEPVGEAASLPMNPPPLPPPPPPPPPEGLPVHEPPGMVTPPSEEPSPEEPPPEEPPILEPPGGETPLPPGVVPSGGLPPGEVAPGPGAGVPTLDPNLTDPTAPGPTLDTGLVVQIQDNLRLVVAINRNPDIANALAQDPTQLGRIEQDLGLAQQRTIDPSHVTGQAAVAGLDVPEPDVPEPGPLDQDLDDQPNP